MASETLSRDQNHITVAAAITNDSDQFVEMFRVDPVTNYLLINITSDSATSANTGNVAKRDQNHVPVCLAYDEINDQVVEVLTDANGYLLLDVFFTA